MMSYKKGKPVPPTKEASFQRKVDFYLEFMSHCRVYHDKFCWCIGFVEVDQKCHIYKLMHLKLEIAQLSLNHAE